MRSRLTDAAAGVILFSFGVIGGTAYTRLTAEAGLHPVFYQIEFTPAVTMACGRGYINVDASSIPALAAFLRTDTDRFECSNLPAQLHAEELSGQQATWRYLLGTIALTWMIAGDVSWASVQVLSGLFFGLTVALCYAGFRLLGGVGLAAAGAAAVLTSPIHLRELPHVRDYSKAPFMIACGIVLGVLLSRRLTGTALCAWTALFGVVLGVGVGFRNDLLITVPVFVAAALVGACRADRGRFTRFAAAVTAGAIAFLVCAAPVLGTYREGGGAGMQHVALLGFTAPFDKPLGVTPSPVYSFLHAYSDSHVAVLVTDFAARVQRNTSPITVYGPMYDRAASGVLQALVTSFPADVWLRGVSAFLRVVSLPASSADDVDPPPALHAGAVARFFDVRANALRGREMLVLGLVAAAFAVGAALTPSVAVPLFLAVAYFSAYPAIQFHDRHYFHLNAIAIAAAIYLLSATWSLVRVRDLRSAWTRYPVRRSAAGLAALAGTIMLVLVAPVAALRPYQERLARTAFGAFEAAARETVSVHEDVRDDGSVLLEPDLPAERLAYGSPRTVQSEYLVAEFASGACDAASVRFEVRYSQREHVDDFSRSFVVQPPVEHGRTATLFFPVYYSGAGPHALVFGFTGLALRSEQRSCLTGLSRVVDTAAIPLLLDLRLPSGWRSATLHQTLSGWEAPQGPDDLTVHVAPAGITVRVPELSAPLSSLTDAELEVHADNASMRQGRLRVLGAGGIGGRGRYMYLAKFRDAPVRANRRLLAEGVLHSGGLNIGLLDRAGWVVQAPLIQRGRFVLILEIPRDVDAGAVVVANHLEGWSLRNDFEITRMGWLLP